MATVRLSWRWSEDQALAIEVEADLNHPDGIDELCHRAVYLLNESLAAVTTPEETT